MDFWVVAAATGAGYVAKHWQNLSGEKDSSSKLSPVLSPRVQSGARQVFGKLPNSVFPLPKLARRCLLDEDVSSPEEEHSKVGMNLQDHNELPVSGLAPIFIEKQVFQDNEDEINRKHGYFDTSGHHLHQFRTKNTNVKSCSSVRPLVVTRNDRDSGKKQWTTQVDDMKAHKIVFMEENKASMEAACFEPAGSVKLPRRPKQMRVQRFETKNLHSQGTNMVSLFLGITIGILSTTVTNQCEVEHLNELLEQAENMVQDLHNKLEMKDRFTTKEHDIEADETANNSPKAENFELTSDIEAELEAELERLEENMKGCTLQRLSNVVEIDSDVEADMARGDLNLEAVTWQLDSQKNSDHGNKTDESESAGQPIFNPNYAISSLDLRLRLHKVIESELKARIEELEAVLQNQNSQSKPHSPEPQEANSFWDFDHTRMESSSSTP